MKNEKSHLASHKKNVKTNRFLYFFGWQGGFYSFITFSS
jgi:hypothetical protein